MNIVEAIILGVVEGITEYLPISSTGHLIIAQSLLGLNESREVKSQIDSFIIMIQGGAILAVIGVFWPRVRQMLRGLIGRDEAGRGLVVNLLVAFLPAAVLGVLLDELIEGYLFYAGPVIAALLLGGVLMIFLGRWQRRTFHEAVLDEGEAPHDALSFVDIEHLTWRRALIVGLLQCVAMWPGTSRSMMTIVGGMLVGMRPRHAAEFSFLLGLPTLGGACIYKGAKNFLLEDQNVIESLGVTPVLVGFAVATIAAAISVKWLIEYLTKHGLAIFGWYRIVLSVVLAGMLAGGMLDFPATDELPAVNESQNNQHAPDAQRSE